MFRKLVAVVIFSFVAIFSLYAQEEDGDWFWDKPITKIEFEGLKNVKKSELSGITSSYIDMNFTEDNYNDLLDRLYALDLFEDIEPYAKHANKDNDDILLVFKVVEHPVISKINFYGNQKIRNAELRELIKIKTSDVFIESKLLIDERTIRDHYLGKGYSDVKISHKIDKRDSGIEITFNIAEGSTTVIKEIHISGNSIVSERVLKNKLALKEVGIFKDGAFQNTILEADKRTIASYYAERGYIDANVVDVRIETLANEEKQRNELIITFFIQEGYQYTFSGFKVEGNEVFTDDDLLPLMKLKVGSVFNATKFEEGVSSITGKYYESGYMSNEFYRVPAKDTEKKEVAYTLSVVEHLRSHIENIIVKGNSKTKDYVITREIPLESGDVFSRDKIMNGLRNLYNLQYFSNVIPDVQFGSEENLVDLVVSVEEQSTTSLQFGMTFSGISEPGDIPISLYAKFENSNLLGEGKDVSTSVTVSKTEQSIDFTYAQGWIGNLPITWSESLSFSHNNTYALTNMFLPDMSLNQFYYYNAYEGYSASLGTAFARRWTPDFAILTATAGMNNEVIDYIYDTDLYTPVDLGLSNFANRLGLSNSLFTSFSIDDRDINYDPTSGWFASQRFSWYGLLPVEKEFYLKSDTKLEGYLKLCDVPVSETWNLKLVLAGYSGLTMLFPTKNSYVTDSSKVYIDGMFNGRGWTEAFKNGGRGKLLWSNRVELRSPLVPGIVGLDLFHDIALITGEPENLFNGNIHKNDWYYSFGPGVRFLIPQFPLHLLFTWRYKVDDGKLHWGTKADSSDPFQFVLSFNIVNK